MAYIFPIQMCIVLTSTGMVLGAIVRCLSSEQGEESVYSCMGLNSTPHTLMVNVTRHIHSYRHIGKVSPHKSQGYSMVSASHKVTLNIEFHRCLYTGSTIALTQALQ